MSHPHPQYKIRSDLATYARKRDGATDKAERAYYAELWQVAINRLNLTLIYK